ncbi:PepSY domain-containing protein [Ensifer sp. ENS12]|uniref:PepSY-associated TM helix domain-containing protein n=1 Tax=Ensifer sp. ENS12 TaxID=2854774 RepID=UPI001C44AA0A|nr:PepSY domain-containing protein [Ensifer sp. ENS12]MBV7516099.1 PepSY domain-containing protein [Ensifer sp. ENS12]
MATASFTGAAAQPVAAERGISLYRAIWRWHFFAGLLVIPFMISLAVTGGLYLFNDEIDDTVFAYRNIVPAGTERLPPSAIVATAVESVPGSAAVSYRTPAGADRSARVTVGIGKAKMLVFVDPYTGAILDHVAPTDEFNQVVEDLHSLDYFGKSVETIIEIVAGFAILLVFTGIYLWWPRQQTGGVLTVRGTPARRVFWRDLHAVTGIVAGLLIVFLAFSGLLWSGYWGATVNGKLTAMGLGYPAVLWDQVPTSTKVSTDVLPRANWLMENAPVPTSSGVGAEPVGIDRAVAIADEAGMLPGYELALPTDESGVYTAAIFPAELARERTIHIDQYSGKPLVDVAFGDYPALGKAIEWSINVHKGQEWGRANQLLMLAACLSIVLISLSAVVMWWKRRPAGRVGVPPMPPKRSVYAGLWIMAIFFGLTFPLTGLAIVIMVVADQLLMLAPAARRRLS